MEKATQRDALEVYEIHHILPKSLGGKNLKENMVRLSPREHFIAHALLTKMVHTKEHKRSMAYAFSRMKVSNNSAGYSRIGNGKLYETLRLRLKELYSGENNPFYGDKRFIGKNNPFYGKTHTKETIKKIKDANRDKFGEKNPFYGKKHTDELKKRLSVMRIEPVVIMFLDGTEKKFNSRGEIGQYLGICKSLGVQLCTIKRHLWSKYNIKEILYEVSIDKKSTNGTSL